MLFIVLVVLLLKVLFRLEATFFVLHNPVFTPGFSASAGRITTGISRQRRTNKHGYSNYNRYQQ
jgi:hypothetical protein